MKPTVLYIDDEFINIEVFKANFEDDYELITAESGEEGLKILEKENNISVVISDMKMSEMDGLEFINIAKTKYPDLICFLLTGYLITDDILEAIEKKIVTDSFIKPFNKEKIDREIYKALNSK